MIETRAARPDDVASIADIHVRTWQDAYRDLLPSDFLNHLNAEQRKPQWVRAVTQATPGSRVIVAFQRHSGREYLVGFCSVGPARGIDRLDIGELYAIYVDPHCQRTGAGTALIDAGEQALREHGFREAILWVLEGNIPARTFYARSGWWLEPQTKADTIAGLPIVERCYRKNLAT